MTAIALRDVSDVATVAAQPTDLARWAQQAREAANVAVSLAKTPFVPASLRDRDPGVTAANITACILTGQELGLEPMAALRSIDVIQGTPALRALTMRAVVLAHGHDIWVAESTATRAIVRGRRRGSEQVQESAWTLDRARALGLVSKDNWRKQPAAMLIARATAECARLVAADALLGLGYASEELSDGDPQIVPSDEGPAAPTARTARRRSAQPAPVSVRPPVAAEDVTPDPEPDLEPSGLDEFHEATTQNPQAAVDAATPITKAQQTALHAALGDLNLTDRDDKLAFCGEFLDRTIGSSSDISKDEASRLLDHIAELVAAREASHGDGTLPGTA